MKRLIAIIIVSVMLISLMSFSGKTIAQGQAVDPTVTFSPTCYNASQVNEVFTVNITISNVQNLWAWHADVAWDPTTLSMPEDPAEGDFMTQHGTGTLFMAYVNNSLGVIKGGISDTIITSKVVSGQTIKDTASGSGLLATLTFKVLKACMDEPIRLENLTLQAPYTGTLDASAGGTPIIPASTSSAATVSLIIPGAPTANAGKDQTVGQHTIVTFNASKSICTGQNPTYTWTFNDGTPKSLTGQICTYIFDNEGVYVVTLSVQDSLGTNDASITITVKDTTPPVATILYQGQPVTSAIMADKNQVITLDASSSYDPNGTVSHYNWFVDGDTSSNKGTEAVQNISFPDAAIHTVTVVVTDDSGNKGNSTVSINVGNIVPSQTPDPSSGSTGSTNNPNSTDSGGSHQQQQQTSQSSDLPLSVVCILGGITVFVLGGSAFWLRKKI